jgi:hypothetical protein
MTRPRLVLATACVLALTLSARDVNACVCEDLGDAAQQFKLSRVAFVGRIIFIEVTKSMVAGIETEDMVATFSIERHWKGAQGRTVRVRTCGTQTMICTCGVDFQLGQRYVVLAAGTPLETSTCWLTQTADGAEDIIRKLDAATKQ